MSKHLDLLFEHLDRSSIRAVAEGIGVAVALTSREFVTAKKGLLRRWDRLERFPLEQLEGLRVVPNPSANLLQLQFTEGSDWQVVTVMFPPEAAAQFSEMIGLLQEHLRAREVGGSHGQKA